MTTHPPTTGPGQDPTEALFWTTTTRRMLDTNAQNMTIDTLRACVRLVKAAEWQLGGRFIPEAAWADFAKSTGVGIFDKWAT